MRQHLPTPLIAQESLAGAANGGFPLRRSMDRDLRMTAAPEACSDGCGVARATNHDAATGSLTTASSTPPQ